MRLRLVKDKRLPDVGNLQRAIERYCGRKVRELVRFSRGASSLNYLGRWFDADSRFVLKLISSSRGYERLVAHLEKSTGPVVKEVKGCPRFDFGRFRAIFLEWCSGSVVPFDRLFKVVKPADFLTDYETFASAVQSASDVAPAPDYPLRYRMIERDFGPAFLPRHVDKEIFGCFRRFAESKVVIHGDFQADNLRFEDGRLTHVLDIEEFRHGHPVEDFVRYASCSAGHLPWFSFLRRRRIVRNLSVLATLAGYDSRAWTAAIYENWFYKLCRYHNRETLTLFRSFWLRRWLGFYERMARDVARQARVFDAKQPRCTGLDERSGTFASKD